MLDPEFIGSQLDIIVRLTKGAEALEPPGGFFGNSVAKERRVLDDIKSGRIAWMKARHEALLGLMDLRTRRDSEAAQDRLCRAQAHVMFAWSGFIKERDMDTLVTSAALRGRHRSELNQRVVEAVRQQEERGLKGKAARVAALKSDPALAAECREGGLTDRTIARAVQRARKLEK